MLFSLIVPVYNVEKYLETCVDSILNQSFQDFEIILVDDGSTDLSSEICDSYKEKDERIKVIHKKNEGSASAWLTGIEVALGDYVGSIDSDDYVDIDFLKTLQKIISQYACDIVVYGYESFGNENNSLKFPLSPKEGLYNKKDIEKVIIPRLINEGCFERRNALYLSRINKFVKRELLIRNKQFYLNNISFGEDNIWTIPNILNAQSIYVLSDYYPYRYRYNPESITHRYTENLWSQFEALDHHTVRILKKMGRAELVNQVYRDSVFHAAVAINNAFYGDLTRKEQIADIYRIVNNNMVHKGTKMMDKKRCSKKEKINLFLIKYKMIYLIYLIKKIQKGKK